jgi:hypothetical protein
LKGLERALKYIMNPAKTEPHLITAIGCEAESAYHEMVAVKRDYRKDTGRQFIHFVQSFAPYDKVTPEIAHEIAVKLCEKLKGFQVVTAVHTDKAHIHSHFIINTVNYENGMKWKKSAKDLQELKDFSDNLCREYGLLVTNGEKGNYKNPGEYRAQNKGQSWKHELYLAASECLRNSASKDEFIINMEKMGYKVLWTDEHKYITFTTADGKKCRNKKLGEKFSKENMQKTFELNKQYADHKELQSRMNLLLETIFLLSRQNKDQGGSHRYPLSALEGQALKEKAIEMQSRGLDWDKGNGYEM